MNVSQKLKNAMHSQSVSIFEVSLEMTNLSLPVGHANRVKIYSELSNPITENLSIATHPLGAIPIGKITFELGAIDTQQVFNENDVYEVQIINNFMFDDGTTETIKSKKYTTTKIEYDQEKQRTKFEAEDGVPDLNRDFIPLSVTYPITFKQWVDTFASNIGITLNTTNLFNGSFVLKRAPNFELVSNKQVLQKVLEFALSFAFINDNNQYQIVRLSHLFKGTNIDVMTRSVKAFKAKPDFYKTLGVNRLVLGLQAEIDGENVTREDAAMIAVDDVVELRINDVPFAYDEATKQQVIDTMFTEIKGFKYKAYESESKLFYFDLGDIVRQEINDNGDYYNIPILSYSRIYDGKIMTKHEAMSESIVKTENTNKKLNPRRRTEILVDKINQEISLNVYKKTEVDRIVNEIETTPGKSAYEVALENGYTGTEQEWLDSLQGMDGENGIPGKDGADGKPTYTWVKYADAPTSGMSNSATDKKYIGLAFNKSTPTMSTNYADYQWSLMPQNITVGGRNLFLNSKGDFVLLPKETGTAGDNYNYYIIESSRITEFKIDNTFTISGEIEITDGDFEEISIYEGYPGGLLRRVAIENGKFKHTFELVSETADRILIYAGVAGATRGNGMILRHVKLEKGDIATDWTPAPEDVDAEIRRVEVETTAKIDVTTELIQLEKSTRETELYGTGEVDEDGNPIGGLVASVRESAGRITILDDKITDEVNSRAELDDRFSEYKAQTELGETYWQVDIANKLTGKVDQEVIDLFNIFFRVDLQKGAIIGRQGQPVQIVIDNDRILFQENEVTFAYWEGGTMHVDHIIATITATIGYHQISKYDSPYGKTSIIQIEQEAI